MTSLSSTGALLNILSFLSYQELIKTSLVNKEMKNLTNNEILWKKLLEKDFPDFFPFIDLNNKVRFKTAKEWYQFLKETELERKVACAYYVTTSLFYEKKDSEIISNYLNQESSRVTRKNFLTEAANYIATKDQNICAILADEINAKLRKILLGSTITKEDLQLTKSDIGFIGLNLLQTLSFSKSNKLLQTIFALHPNIAKEEEAASLLSLDCQMLFLSSDLNQNERLQRVNDLLDLNVINVDESISDSEDIAVSIRAKATLYLNEQQFILAMVNADDELKQKIKDEIAQELKQETTFYYGFYASYALESYECALKIAQAAQPNIGMSAEVKQTFERITAIPSASEVVIEDRFFRKLMTIIDDYQKHNDMNYSPSLTFKM